jgi:hypothetical protein
MLHSINDEVTAKLMMDVQFMDIKSDIAVAHYSTGNIEINIDKFSEIYKKRGLDYHPVTVYFHEMAHALDPMIQRSLYQPQAIWAVSKIVGSNVHLVYETLIHGATWREGLEFLFTQFPDYREYIEVCFDYNDLILCIDAALYCDIHREYNLLLHNHRKSK